MKILKFEFKKFFSSSKNILVLFIVLFLVFLVCFQKSRQLKLDKEELLINDTYLQAQLISEIDNAKEIFPKEVRYLNIAVIAIQKKWNYADNNDWFHALKQEIVFIDSIQKVKKKIPLNYIDNNVLKSKGEKIFFLEHHIKPDNSLYGVSALYYVRLVISILFSIYGLLIFIFLFYDLFSKEVEKKTINLLLTQPISYKSILISKLMTTICIFGLFLLCILTFTFLVGIFLSNQPGEFKYPMSFAENKDRNLTNLDFSIFFVVGILLFSCIVYFMVLFSSFLSRMKISSERILLVESGVCILCSQIGWILTFKRAYLWGIPYINLANTLIKTYKQNHFIYNVYEICVFVVTLFTLTKILFKKKGFV